LHAVSQWLTEGSKALAILGLSVVGLVSIMRQVILRGKRRIYDRLDRKRLGEHYLTWQRLAAISASADVRNSLAKTVETTKVNLTIAAIQALRDDTNSRLDRLASGTQKFSYRDLVMVPGMLLPTRYVDTDGSAVASLSQAGPDMSAALEWEADAWLDGGRVLVVGPAGSGKSILCRTLEHAWVLAGGNERWLVTIERTDFIGGDLSDSGSGVGSREWLTSLLARRLFAYELSPLEKRVLSELVDSRVDVIIDSIDEIASQLSARDMEEFLDSWVFSVARLSTVRTSYFDSTLSGTTAAERLRIIWCAEFSEDSIQDYVEDMCRRIYKAPAGKTHAARVQALRKRIPDLRELTHNPLLLNMCITLRELPGSNDSLDVSTVYREFVTQTLARDWRAGRTILEVPVAIAVLAEFAWLRRHPPHIGPADMRTVRAAVAAVGGIDSASQEMVAKVICQCPLLSLRYSPLSGGPDDFDAQFYHDSFEDYLVARRVEDWLLGRSPNGEDFFDHIDSPEVTFFLSQSTSRLSRDHRRRRFAANRLLEAFVEKQRLRRESDNERIARTLNFAAGQMAYYLGIMGDRESQETLAGMLLQESDFWIRRSGAFGLAFGGSADSFHSFIDEMRREIADGEFTMARKNIGVELGFYGDQHFDTLDPTFDAGGASCKRLVARAGAELKLYFEVANWRIVLFNLIYLGTYRKASLQSLADELRGSEGEFRDILDSMSADPERSRFPEVREFKALLERVSPSRGQNQLLDNLYPVPVRVGQDECLAVFCLDQWRDYRCQQ
jgi:hypothetical protein